MSTQALMDGFRILEQLSVEEIEKRVLWLEEALATYKTLLAVKRCHQNKPTNLDTPDEWISEVDMDKEKPKRKAKPPGWYKEHVIPILREHAGGLTTNRLAELLSVESHCLYQYLYVNRNTLYHYERETETWTLRNGTINRLEQV